MRSRRARPKRGFPPIQVLIGWIGESSRKDVLAHARGFVAKTTATDLGRLAELMVRAKV